jgi:hypothetical protein
VKTVIMSLWRNDGDRNLLRRAQHLIDKTTTHGTISWLWAVGDCTDRTELRLRNLAVDESIYNTIRVMNVDTNIIGEDTPARRIRSSRSATAMFAHPDVKSADFVLLHESDLISPTDVIDRLMLAGKGEPCAGWPIINLGKSSQFYDIWAYAHANGKPFDLRERRPAKPIPVSSFGSVWLAPASIVCGRVLHENAIRDLCKQWKNENIPMWCDATTEIVQPVELWEAS